jgi:hypothetical protein
MLYWGFVCPCLSSSRAQWSQRSGLSSSSRNMVIASLYPSRRSSFGSGVRRLVVAGLASFVVLTMMSAPFRQQIDEEGSMLRIIEARDWLTAHDDVIRVALVAARSVDAVDARAGAYNTVSRGAVS